MNTMKLDLLPLLSGYLFTDRSLLLKSGLKMSNLQVAYTMSDNLSAMKPIILICHALTGDQFVLERNPVTGRGGWWSEYVGPEKPIDTNRYNVICTNVLGGCMGTTGPASSKIDASEDKIWGADFPVITIQDMVNLQFEFLKSIGVSKLYAIIGGSMGGMQALEWLRLYPEFSNKFIIISSSFRQAAINIGYHEIGRKAIMMDANWCSGFYHEEKKFPSEGLGIARMMAHITYLSSAIMENRFNRRLQNRNKLEYSLSGDFEVESYLNHQGNSFPERFDPGSYIYMTKAVDYFDQSTEFQGGLTEVYANANVKGKVVDLVSFNSDSLYTSNEMLEIYEALMINGVRASFKEIDSIHGHDSFLKRNQKLMKLIKNTIL